jgi:hypothetical protein
VTDTTEMEALLRWFADHELDEDLRWTTHRSPLVTWVNGETGETEPSGPIRFYILCNDVFWWGTADCEWVTAADLPDLQATYDDLVMMDGCEMYTPELWIARKRMMRPQRPWWQDLTERVQSLFLAAGPERDPKEEG